MSLYRELSYDGGDIDIVTGLQFCIMSPEDIRSRSVVPDVSNQTYSNNEPVHGGLFDRRMGVVDANVLCQTCEQRNTFCPGHFGHVELAKPLFHFHFFETVRSLLRCICYRCSRVPVKLEEAPEIKAIASKRISRQKKWELMHKLLQKIKKCPHCGMRQPDKCSRVGILRIELEWRGVAAARNRAAEQQQQLQNAAAVEDSTVESSSSAATGDAASSNNGEVATKIVLGADDVLRMFRRMTDEDINMLGFCKHQNRPEWMICTVLLVPPPSVRPTVKNEVGQRQEDDLTTKLINIIKYNQQVKVKLEKGQKEQADALYKMLQYEVATLIDNNIQGIPPSQVMRTGRPMRALSERLKSKEGRIRGNLMGKRVDFSARSVITPDPNISIDELGVPRRIAMNLTFPEIVSRFTRERLAAAVRAGPDRYPGAKFVLKVLEGPRKIRLKSLTQEELDDAAATLVDGDVVERHLVDGDVVLFNRQPSLHKMSMMGHRVRVMDYNTFRLNVCVTPNFNADFDGDEMNMHVPQSMQTHEELAQLAWVMNQVISPRECKPIISVVQDIALGIYRMTRPNLTVSVRQLMNMMISNAAALPKRIDDRTRRIGGHELLSTIVPKGVFTSTNGVTVLDGEIQPGSAQVTKKVYQEQSNGLVHAIHNSLGRDATRRFFDDTQKLVCDFLVMDGFSVGISDLVVSVNARAGFREVFKRMRKQVDDMVKSVHEGTMVNTSNKNDRDFFESQVNDILNEARNDIGKIAKEVGEKDNRLLSMINAGSKGNDINMAQMVGCVGQVAVDGKRIPYSFDNRTLPHYARYDDGPQARGFVRNSFISGLTPQEFFFHSMGGREGLIDTAVKTSETGYIQRKLVKAMEDFKIAHDGTVRNAAGTIVQFLYGDEGMDPIKIERQKLPHLFFAPAAIAEAFRFTAEELRGILLSSSSSDLEAAVALNDAHVDRIELDREFVVVDMFGGRVGEIEFPVHVARILMSESAASPPIGKADADWRTGDPVREIVDGVERLVASLRVNRCNGCPRIFAVILRALLAPKPLLTGAPTAVTSSEAFGRVLAKIRRDFYASIADASEMVGVVAAQSISEPTTQLTLNTFHLSGVASASTQVRGVPRLKEIIDCTASKNLKTPVMKVYLQESWSQSKVKCIEMMNKLCVVRFKDVVSRSRIYFDPAETIGAPSHIESDSLFLDLYSRFDALNRGAGAREMSPWVLRLEFDRQKMLDRGLTMIDIDRAILSFYGDDRMSCIFTDDNASEVAMRVRLTMTGPAADASTGGGDDLLTEIKALEHNLLEVVPIRGVERIDKVRPIETLKYQRFNPSTKTFEPFSELMIETDGSNMMGVMNVPGVDAYRVTSNDVYEVFRTLGVEAARQKLYDEILEVLNMTYINYRHVALLVDAITNKGTLVSVNRHGINQGDNGPLAKCSFEETVVRLVKAGIFSERDRMNGVSANIMLGQVAPCGTGDSKIAVDASALPKKAQPPPPPDALPQASSSSAADAAASSLQLDDDELFSFNLQI